MRVQDRKVAMVYQQFINYPSMTVYDNIASPLRLMRKSKAEIDRAVQSTAEMLRLTPMLDRKPLELSGGQQQRCALARALVKEAGLVLLDEPLANLDYKLREELRAEIPRIFAESGAIFVYATTEPEEALLLGGNTATLWEGRVTQFGPTPRVYRRPADATTARVFSDPPMNFVALTKDGRSDPVRRRPSPPVPATGGPARRALSAGFRPNHLHMRDPGGDALRFDCRLDITEITGSETFIHLTLGAATLGRAGARHPRPGTRPAAAGLARPGACLRLRRGWPAGRRGRLCAGGLRGGRWHRSRSTTSPIPTCPNRRRGRLGAQATRPRLAGWRRLCAARRLGLRQVHAAEHHLGPADTRRAGASCSATAT
jgi:ABC-type sugar transport system ATPase subunit